VLLKKSEKCDQATGLNSSFPDTFLKMAKNERLQVKGKQKKEIPQKRTKKMIPSAIYQQFGPLLSSSIMPTFTNTEQAENKY
jgi:hypothetical protein